MELMGRYMGMRGMASADDIASAVAYVASDEAHRNPRHGDERRCGHDRRMSWDPAGQRVLVTGASSGDRRGPCR